MNQYPACLGIDWADKKHDLCLLDTASGKKTRLVLPHTPQAINEYFALLQFDFLVIYTINPTTLAKYRARFLALARQGRSH
jgi:hypothetical protein